MANGSLTLALALLAAPSLVQAQSASGITYSYTTSGTAAIPISPGGTVGFPSTVVGTSTSATFTLKNGTGSDAILNSITFSGTGFSLSGTPSSYPVTLKSGGTLSFQVGFSPLAVGHPQGTLQVNYQSSQDAFVLSGQAATSLQSLIFSYIVNPGGNQTAINADGAVPFNSAAVNASSTVTFIIHNSLTGAAASNSLTVAGVSVTGAGFLASGLPLFPATIAPSSDLRFTLTFAPTSATAFTGGLTVTLLDSSANFVLQGQGIAPALLYQFLTDSGYTAVAPQGTITISPVALTATTGTSTTVQVTNTGTANGSVGAIAFTTSTTSFALTQLPALPASLAPGASLTFVIVFTPKTVGDNNATLRIDNALFTVDATGLGPLLQISVDTGAGPTVVANNAVLAIPNTTVGDKRTLPVVLQNNGNQPATVNAISATGTGYSLNGLPALPVSLNPGDTVALQLVFGPNSVGTLSGSLQVETQSITLRGVGSAPPALPGVTINVANQLQPQQQPTAGITLASSYPYDLTGVLTMTFTSTSFVSDPSIQFASGGRTIAFKIPANSSQAVFGNPGSPQALFQVGTISGQLQFTATFADQTVDVTPQGSAAPTQTSSIPAAAPVISSIALGPKTATSITVNISGYSNTRELSQMVFAFTGTASSNITTGPVTANVQSAFGGWYQGTASQTYGSQFTASIVFNVTGDLTTLQSVAVTATNSQGTSTSQSIALN